MQPDVSFVIEQLLWLAPQLIVVSGGLVLAAMWWRRAPRAATLAMIGLGLMLVCQLASTGLNAYWSSGRGGGGAMIPILTYCLYILRTVGLGVLVAAVFTSRPPLGQGRAFELQNVRAAASASSKPPSSPSTTSPTNTASATM